MDYLKAWKFLDDLQFFKIKLGLESIECFLDKLGRPHTKLKFIHIAGTNGKGSTAVSLLNIMSDAGYKVGMYSSPHLSSVRERFRINDKYISEIDFAGNASRIINILNGSQITYFEFTTALALLWFVEQKVDLVILEVGMGGRLDATNVVTPLISIITNVSMDHEAYLGETLAEVSFEKAGVIKKNVPVITGAALDESRTVICDRAHEVGVPVYILGVDFSCLKDKEGAMWDYQGISKDINYSQLEVGLIGEHQAHNAALSLATVEFLNNNGFSVPLEAVRQGLKRTRWPGRLEYIVFDKLSGKYGQDEISSDNNLFESHSKKIGYLLDGAHNPAGIASLIKVLKEDISYNSLIGVWACMEDKKFESSLMDILPFFDHIILTRLENERSAQPSDIKKLLPHEIQIKSHCVPQVRDAIRMAEKLASPGDLICVAGSLYLIGAVRVMLLGELVP